MSEAFVATVGANLGGGVVATRRFPAWSLAICCASEPAADGSKTSYRPLCSSNDWTTPLRPLYEVHFCRPSITTWVPGVSNECNDGGFAGAGIRFAKVGKLANAGGSTGAGDDKLSQAVSLCPRHFSTAGGVDKHPRARQAVVFTGGFCGVLGISIAEVVGHPMDEQAASTAEGVVGVGKNPSDGGATGAADGIVAIGR